MLPLLVALLLVALTSCGATLAVVGIAPTMLSEGSCSRPVETLAERPMWVIGSAAGLTDSLWRNPGDPFRFAWQLPQGEYRVTVWARNGAGPSCSTSVVVATTSRPSPPRLTNPQ